MVAPSVVERITTTALESAFELETGVEIRSCHRPASGSVADTFVLELETGENAESTRSGPLPGRVVCKLGGANVWTGDVVEPLVVERVGESSALPVPTVIATGTVVGGKRSAKNGTGAARGDRWALYEFVGGYNADSIYRTRGSSARYRLVAEAGAALGQLHALSRTSPQFAFDRVGGLARRDGELEWRALETWRALDPAALRSAFPAQFAGERRRPVLTHGDYQPSNLLATPEGEITAILDWGNARVTDAEYALARAEARFVDLHVHRLSRRERGRLRRTFRHEYARREPLSDEFDERAPLYKLLWACQAGINYARIGRSARGRKQLWRQCRRLLESNS